MVTSFTEDFPLRPVHPEDQAGVFLEAAAQLAEAGPTRSELDLLEGGATVPQRAAPEVSPSQLRERLYAGNGAPVHLGAYTVTRYLDGGATGDVFEARLGGQRLAMKVLRQVNAQSLARFKREFRGAQGICHRNLVTVHELVAEDDEWFFTMEHVDGPSFLAHVRGAARRGGRAPPRASPGKRSRSRSSSIARGSAR